MRDKLWRWPDGFRVVWHGEPLFYADYFKATRPGMTRHFIRFGGVLIRWNTYPL